MASKYASIEAHQLVVLKSEMENLSKSSMPNDLHYKFVKLLNLHGRPYFVASGEEAEVSGAASDRQPKSWWLQFYVQEFDGGPMSVALRNDRVARAAPGDSKEDRESARE